MKLKARMNLSIVVFVCYFLAIQSLAMAVIEDLDPCTNTTSSDCCLCSQTSCDTDCPPSLFGLVANSNTYHCNLSDTEMEVTTVPETTTTTTATTTTTLLSFTKRNTTSDLNATEDLKITTESDSRQTTDSTHKSTPIIVCVTSCPTGYFHDNGRNCTKCDIACKECNSSGSDGCLECKLTYNNTCYAVCPINTVQKNLTCVDKDSTDIGDDSDKKILPIIIGASVGGAAVVVLVVVIVVCCRRRRRQGSGTPGTNKSRLSGILEEKKHKDHKERKGKGPVIPRRDYENTAPRDSTLKHAIPTQGDNVLRYTKDPTESVKANTLKPEAPEPKNRDSTYANAETILLAKNMVGKPTVSEEQEIEALPLAPMAPPGTPDEDRGRKHTKSKVPFSKRISQKLNLKHKKKEKDKPPVDKPGQTYIDMSHTTPVTERKSDNQSTEHDEEDYENTLKKMAKNQSKPGKSQTGVKPGKPQTGIKSGKKQTAVEEGLEDYENAPEKLETQSKVNPEDGEQEDYEVMNEGGQAYNGETGESGGNTEDQLEDYENIKPLAKAGNSKKPVIPVGKTKELMKKFEKSKVPEKTVEDVEAELEDYENLKPSPKKGAKSKPKAAETKKKGVKKVTEPVAVGEDSDGLEDYENTAVLSKVVKSEQTDDNFVADTEEPYENVKMEKGKMKQRKQ